jgi:ribosomal-protein-serine acetyltransferase
VTLSPQLDSLGGGSGLCRTERFIAEDAQGKGTMTTVVRALVDYAFEEWKLHRLEVHCAPVNHRSRAIPERLGFREEALLREAELVGGRYLDSVVYGLLASDLT